MTVIIADDHPFTLAGTHAFVAGLGYTVLDLCSSGISACNSIIARKPDIALLDMSMPGMNGIEILEKLSKIKSATSVVLLTMHNEISIFNRARALGVKGYILKEHAANELEDCLKQIASGGACFSPQLNSMLVVDEPGKDCAGMEKLTFSERKILELIGRQQTTRTIAQNLFITEKTVENHRSSILRKLNLPPGKNALLIWAMKHAEMQ